MAFFKNERSGPKVGGTHNQGKKKDCQYGPQHEYLGNGGTNGKIPITKKAKSNLE